VAQEDHNATRKSGIIIVSRKEGPDVWQFRCSEKDLHGVRVQRERVMSKSAYLYDEGDHNGPHLMFFTALKDGKNWGAGASGSPVVSGPYWFLSSKEPSQAKGLPPILVFAVEVAKWSDGTAAPMDQE
jgi:hypothetical protein